MGTITALSIIKKAHVDLQDVDGERWTQDELLKHLNEAQGAVLVLKPDAYVLNKPILLAAGTRQALPTDGLMLFDMPRNLGANGTTPGRAVRRIERELLDTQVPNWHGMQSDVLVKHFTYSVSDKKVFYVYPPANGTSYVELVYSAMPPLMTINSVIALDDNYESALHNWVMYRAKLKEDEYGADPVAANGYLNGFAAVVTGKANGEAVRDPNRDAAANPSTKPPRS